MIKVAKIDESLDEVRKQFHDNLVKKLGVPFPKYRADGLLSEAIKQSNILNNEVKIKKNNKRGMIFDIEF